MPRWLQDLKTRLRRLLHCKSSKPCFASRAPMVESISSPQPIEVQSGYPTVLTSPNSADISQEAVPSISTVERAAAAKAYIEAYYSNLNSSYSDNILDSRDPQHLRKLRALKSKGKQVENTLEKSDLQPVRVLGRGSFGTVKLVSHSTSNRVFAMKVIRKSETLQMCQEGHIKAERDFLVQSTKAQSIWVVPLISSFQDHQNLYLVMDYMVGGDFLGLLLREDVLDEKVARSYIAEMICCIQETHRLGWLHRDIKPDNFLICASGHLKISDFGLSFDGHWVHHQYYYNKHRVSLCERLGINVVGDEQDVEMERYTVNSKKQGEETIKGSEQLALLTINGVPASQAVRCFDKSGLPMPDQFVFDTLDKLNHSRRAMAKSIVGTSQYMAPEVVRGETYDGRADWWSIGIMIYECLYGRTPFWSEDRAETKRMIAQYSHYLRFPTKHRVNRPQTVSPLILDPVSPLAIDLMYQLIRHKSERLGSARYELNTPPYFVHADDAEEIKAHPFFDGIDWSNLYRQRPPWIPDIRDNMTRWFEAEEELIGATEMKATTDVLPKKRPRDKILRDPEHRAKAMEVRKQHAFHGYTFRRSDVMQWFQAVEI